MIRPSNPVAVFRTYPPRGTAEVQLRDFPDAGEDYAVSGWSYHFVLQPGDSVAVTQHGVGENDGCVTVFFHVDPRGNLAREEAPHGLMAAMDATEVKAE